MRIYVAGSSKDGHFGTMDELLVHLGIERVTS